MRPADTVPAVEATPPRPGPFRRRRLVAVAVAVVVVIGVAVWLLLPSGPAPLTPADVDRAVQHGIEQAQQQQAAAPPDATAAYRAIGPSLVTVTTGRPGETGLGSGVVINADGAVLTAFHVVDGAQRIEVTFADGTTSSAQVASSKPESDIAVLVVAQLPQVVVPAVMAGPPPIGDTVFAVGNPLALHDSLSSGVVSGTDRSIATQQGKTLSGLIQFDAAVNPGNSGGPLLNRAGQVVGIVTGLVNPTKQDFFVGIGFAVPIATAGGAAGGPQQ